ncbi:beta strand repeat-containing protein [Granulicella arctica]|uniref:beta strand repeat-containing protein n=1 Tax=Granulicella arctica TaxID=940613 RepID=UPI0021E07708|nr:FG-GAP-like repeat-containing protein [Granulicella arctica]
MLSVSRSLATALLVACCAGAWSASAQQMQYSTLHRDSERALPQTITGGTRALQAKATGARKGLSLAVADFDGDSVRDLVTGYGLADGSGALLLQRGMEAATAPTPREQAMVAAGQFVAPYTAKAEAIAISVHPDLMETADVSGYGHQDLLVAAKGGSTVYLLAGRGDGTFLPARALPFSGPVKALKTWRSPMGQNLIVGSVCGASGCGLQVVAGDGTTVGFAAMPGAVTSMEIAPVNGGNVQDVFAVAGGKAILIDGESLLAGKPDVQTVMREGVVAAVAGYFTYNLDGGMQLAVLGADATMHLFTRGLLNLHQLSPEEVRARRRGLTLTHQSRSPRVHPLKTTGQPWTEVETTPNFGRGTSVGASAPVLIHGHLTGNGNDDLALMERGQYIQMTHVSVADGDMRKTNIVVSIDSTNDPVTAAIATRVAADARMGVVTLGGVTPQIAQLPANRTMNVNTTADSATLNTAACINNTAGCTLRSAIAVVNNDQTNTGGTTIGTTKADTINLPAGTYTLSASNNGQATDIDGDVNIHLDLDGAASIIGAGKTTTIIQTMNTSGHQDNIFDINSGVVNTSSPSFDTYMSGLTIQNGTDTDDLFTNGGSINYQGGLIDWAGDANDALTLVNVVLNNGYCMYNEGGALDGLGLTGNGNVVELDNSTVSNSKTPAEGGAIEIEGNVRVILSGDTISNNTSSQAVTAGYNQGGGLGGGLSTDGPSTGVADLITNTIFSGNTATEGGGGYSAGGGATISGSTFIGNTASGGGALEYDLGNTAMIVTASTFTGNYITVSGTGDGNAVCVDENGGGITNTFTMHYSRLVGNKPPTGTDLAQHDGFALGCNKIVGNVTANIADNWFGCNVVGGNTTGCDGFGVTTGATSNGTFTSTPMTSLSLVLSSTTPIAGATLTATGSLAQDSTGTVYSQANDAAYIGVPASLSVTQHAASPVTSATNLSTLANTLAGIQESVTATVAGTGSATVTVDGCTISQVSAATSSTPFLCNTNTAFNFTVSASDLTVVSAHAGNFKAGDAGDIYTLTATNSGNASSSGTVSVVDTLPSGFSATALTGTGWTCTVSTITCTRSDALAASVSYPAITLTVSIASSDIGTYNNTVAVSGGGETNTSNDTATNPTIVVGQPTISEMFSPAIVAPNASSAVVFTLGNPSANPVSLTGVALSDGLPTNLRVALTPAQTTTCAGGTVTAAANGSTISLSGATIAAGSTCTVQVNVSSAVIGSYINTTGPVTATNSNSGPTATATLNVASSTVALAIAPASPVVSGTVVTLSATVTSTLTSSPALAGVVKFYDTSTTPAALLGTSELSAGNAVIKVVPGVGSHAILAQFQDTNQLPGKTMAQGTLVVTASGNYGTVQSLTAIASGGMYNLTDVSTFYGQVVPGGTVQFRDTTTGTLLGTATPSPLTQTLAAPRSFPSGAAGTGALFSITGDFNKDGLQDVAVANLVEGTVGILLGNGDGTFKPEVSYSAGPEPYQIAVGDFNHDQSVDLVVTNLFANTVSILLGNGDGTFAAPVSYATGHEPYSVTVADLNNDGFLDLVVTNLGDKTVGVLLGNGNGTFTTQTTTAVGTNADTTVAADFNGDGNLDLVVLNGGDNTAGLLLGKGDGTFQTEVTYATGNTPFSATVGDFNGDGLPDLAVANLGGNAVSVLLNAGGGTFTPQVTYATGTEPSSVVALSVDGTGRQSLAVANYTANTVSLLIGNGNGTFQSQVAFPSATAPYQLAVADFNGDGKLDLSVTTFGSNTVNIQLGTQTAIVPLNGVALTGASGSHQVQASYIPGGVDSYSTSLSAIPLVK